MDVKEFHRGHNWRMVLGDPTEKSPIDQVGLNRGPCAGVQNVNDISLEPEDFACTQRLMDKRVLSEASDSGPDSDENTAQPQVSSVAKLFLILLAALTVAIIVPWLFPLGYSGSQLLSLSGDRGRFNAPAGSGDGVSDERSLTPGPSDGSIGSLQEMRPAAQNCLPNRLGPSSAIQPDDLGPSPQGPSAIQAPQRWEHPDQSPDDCRRLNSNCVNANWFYSYWIQARAYSAVLSLTTISPAYLLWFDFKKELFNWKSTRGHWQYDSHQVARKFKP